MVSDICRIHEELTGFMMKSKTIEHDTPARNAQNATHNAKHRG